MKNRIVSISLVVALILSVGLIGCTAEYVPEITEYTLTIFSTEGGSVTTPGQGTESFAYDEGEVVDLLAEPDVGYRFASWTGDACNIANTNAASTTITMNDDYIITATFEEDVVTFNDPNLEAAIRESISMLEGPIYKSDLHGLSYLAAWKSNISNLTGLEHCTNLTLLDLRGNKISDISPLASLTNLNNLILNDNQVVDISPLANLTELMGLGLHNNQINDISPLASLTKLSGLYLNWNQINDISPLTNLTRLTLLYLYGNQINDISPLTNLSRLIYLSLGSNQINDISPLISFTRLSVLYLQWNQISDISPLVENEGLSERDHVFLDGNPLSSDSINTYIPELEARGVDVHY